MDNMSNEIPASELRRSGAVLRRLDRDGPQIVTRHGHPVARMEAIPSGLPADRLPLLDAVTHGANEELVAAILEWLSAVVPGQDILGEIVDEGAEHVPDDVYLDKDETPLRHHLHAVAAILTAASAKRQGIVPPGPASYDSEILTWCPECGPDVEIDEDGCCVSCGCGATGAGVDAAHHWRRRAAPALPPASTHTSEALSARAAEGGGSL